MKIGPLSSLGPSRNARSVRSDIWRQIWAQTITANDLFSLFNEGRITKCICSLGADKLVRSSNIVNVICKWLLKPTEQIARSREFKVVRNIANLRRQKIQITKEKNYKFFFQIIQKQSILLLWRERVVKKYWRDV